MKSHQVIGTLSHERSRGTRWLFLAGAVLWAVGFLAECHAADTWTLIGNMNTPRFGHCATLLNNGKVLLTGGSTTGNVVTNSVEIYDPSTGVFTTVAPMNMARTTFDAIVLHDGRVLVVGGNDGTANRANCEIYDPTANTWTVANPFPQPTACLRLAMLGSGKVLAYSNDDGSGFGSAYCALFDPATGNWTATGSLGSAREWAGGTLLSNGKVIAAGGYMFSSAVELYDPISATWSSLGSLRHAVAQPEVAQLDDGRVLITGGTYWDGSPHAYKNVDIYDPATGTLTAGPDMLTTRGINGIVKLDNGNILVIGGTSPESGTGSNHALAACELFNPTSGSWTAAANLNVARLWTEHSTLKINGAVYVFGGQGSDSVLASVEYRAADTQTWTLQQPFDPANQNTVLATGNGTHEYEGAVNSPKPLMGKSILL